MKSSFFYGGQCRHAARKLANIINAEPDFLSSLTATSPRAVGDAVESLAARHLEHIVGEWGTEFCSAFARRAMADMAFRDKDGVYCLVDVKTHRTDTSFNMPALTSVERLARLYQDDSNLFAIMMVQYGIEGNSVRVSKVQFCPIEFLDWSCLTIGALGWGQIQIADSNNIIVKDGYSRKQWMLSLCEAIEVFYPREIRKIEERVDRFRDVKSFWMKKRDIWR